MVSTGKVWTVGWAWPGQEGLEAWGWAVMGRKVLSCSSRQTLPLPALGWELPSTCRLKVRGGGRHAPFQTARCLLFLLVSQDGDFFTPRQPGFHSSLHLNLELSEEGGFVVYWKPNQTNAFASSSPPFSVRMASKFQHWNGPENVFKMMFSVPGEK